MRLIRRDAKGVYRLIDVFDDYVPNYAILSHTWLADEDELTFEDMLHNTGLHKLASNSKLEFCGEQAARDGLDYFWLDTVCINRPNLTELAEAITLMFSWYQKSTRCYVYLADVSVEEQDANNQDAWEEPFRRARWFTRGWTLQELVAPTSVEFFSRQGIRLGDKDSLETLCHQITNIPCEALRGQPLSNFSIAERLSWTKDRDTKKIEDKAYCLLGIFNVFIPLMYGEKDNAFTRLQEEIEKKYAEASKMDHLLATLPVCPQAAFNSLDNQHGSTCLPNTRAELLENIISWVGSADTRCIYWLSGMAGTGKSTIARTIAREYHEQGCLGGSFFFSKGGGDVARADKLFTTLAWQLATKLGPLVRRHICDAISEQKNIASQSLRDQWEQLILKPLSKLDGSSISAPTVLVIDALDECESDRDIGIILKLLATSKTLVCARLRVFVTSRPHLPIRVEFGQIPEADREVFLLDDIRPTKVDHDLRLFFEHNFMTIREERGYDSDWPGFRILKRLIEISCGLFIWASTACRFIREGKRLAMRRINILINGYRSDAGPVEQLDKIYTAVLEDSISGYNKEEKKELYGIIREVLGSIVLLFSPLSVDSLVKLSPLPPNDITDTLADLHAIFNIPTDPERPVRLHHPTFRDFLLDKNRCSDLNFWVDEKQVHHTLAVNCIRLMRKGLKRDICGLGSPGTLVKDISEELVTKHISPELQYACLYWVQHLRESGSRMHDGDQVDLFFREYYFYWLEAMYLMRKGSEVAGRIRMYNAQLASEDNVYQIPFLQDARRFIFAFQSIMEQAPLQIYCAGLVFVPQENQTRAQFWDQTHAWITDVKMARAISLKAKVVWNFVNDIVFTPDGHQVASGSVNEVVRVWDVNTQKVYEKFIGQTDKVCSVSLTPDGSRIASGSDDCSVMVWNYQTGVVRFELKGHTRWVNCVVYSPDGKLLASGSMDETVRVWSAGSGELIKVLDGNSSGVNSIAFSSDSSLIAAAAADCMLRIFDVDDGKLRMLLDGHSGPINCVRFSPDARRLVSCADDLTVRVWGSDSGTALMTLRGHTRRVMGVAYAPDNRIIASASEDTSIRLWDAQNGAPLARMLGHSSGVNAVAFSHDSRLLVSGSFDDETRLWNGKTGESLGEFEEFTYDVDEKSPLEQGQTEPSSNEKWQSIGDKAASTSVEYQAHASTVVSLVLSPDGRQCASGSIDGTIKVWTLNGAQKWLLEGHTGVVNHQEFSPCNQILASASADSTVRIWDVTSGTISGTLEGHTCSVRAARFSADGRLLVSCSDDRTAILWNIRSGTRLKTFERHTAAINDVAFSPKDQNTLATCSADNSVILWEVGSGAPSKILRRHTDSVNSVSFSPDGTLIVSASADSTIRVWDAAGTARSCIKGHTLPVNAAAISPNNKIVVSCSGDLTLRAWNTDDGSVIGVVDLTTEVCAVAFSMDGHLVHTDRGVLASRLFSTESIDLVSPSPLPLFATTEWVKRGTENVLWLPEEYHATAVATVGDMIVLGNSLGAIYFIHF